MSAVDPETEEERREYMFDVAFGHYILEKYGPEGTVPLKELNPELLHTFFNAGWAQGKGERLVVCKDCSANTEAYPSHKG